MGRQPNKENNLAVRFPDIAREWNGDANGTLEPFHFLPFSSKKVWWKCSHGHSWEAAIGNRTSRSSGCPYCSGKKVTTDKNLAVVNPHLVSEWNYQKNKELLPEQFTEFSGKKMWWICKKGHEWRTTIASRSLGSNCPFCWKHTSVPEFRLLAEFEFIFGVVARRRKFSGVEIDLYLEKYHLGFEYDGSYWHKDKEKRDKKKNDRLAEMDIKIFRVREEPLKKLSPHDVLTSGRGLKKSVVDELLANIKQYCDAHDNKKIDTYISNNTYKNEQAFRSYLTDLPEPDHMNSLAAENKELLSEFDYEKNHPLEPKHFSRGSQELVWWKCEKGHNWKTGVLTMTINKSGCPFCSRNFASPEFNLKDMHPNIALQWHPKKNGDAVPSEVLPTSSKAYWWTCNEGHEWQAAVSSRTSQGSECPFCGGIQPTADNNLVAFSPKIERYWHPSKNTDLKPEKLLPSSGKKIWLKCSNGHEWQAVPNNMQALLKDNKKELCPKCRKKDNSLAIKFPDLLNEWDFKINAETKPNTVSYGSKKKYWWKCAEGHSWETSPNQRTKGNGTGCPQCNSWAPYDKIPVTEKNCLLTTEPDIADEWDYSLNGYVTPKTVRRTCKERVWWKCSHGHSWEAAISNRTSRNSGCPICARTIRANTRRKNIGSQ